MKDSKSASSSNYTKTRWVIEAGIMLALAQVLSYVQIMELSSGGSVTAGSMVPIILFAIRWGYRKGTLVGVAFGALQFLLGKKYSFHPISIFCDYLFAYGFLGLAALWKGSLPKTVLSTAIAVTMRFVSHVVSGVIVFGHLAPAGQTPLVFSILYNSSYLIPELIICVIIVIVLYDPLKRHSPSV